MRAVQFGIGDMSVSGSGFQQMPIGVLSGLAGVKVQTIRYYEEIGLMREPMRTQSNRRSYDGEAVKRLSFIRHARDLGFSISAIRSLIELQAHPSQPCVDADGIAREQLVAVEAKIARLEALKGELNRMLKGCCGSDIASCRVIEVLGDHGLCCGEHERTEKAVPSRTIDG